MTRTGRLGRRPAEARLPKMQHHTERSTEWIITHAVADGFGAFALGAEVALADRAS